MQVCRAVCRWSLCLAMGVLMACSPELSKSSQSSKLSYASARYATAQEVASQPPKVVKEYVPVALPGQLMPMPSQVSMPADQKPILSKEAATQAANKMAMQTPDSRDFFNAMMTYQYMPGAMYVVYTAPMRITDLMFGPGEKIISQAAGDTLRWQIAQTRSGSAGGERAHLLVKPSKSGLENTLVVTTNLRVYHIVLKSTDNNTFMVSVRWTYPKDMVVPGGDGFSQDAFAQPSSATGAGAVSPYQLSLGNLDFNYRFGLVKGSKPRWYPTRIFNDGQQTFIGFSQQFSQASLPILYVADSTGRYSTMVNWRVKGDYMVIDGVIATARLQSGVEKTGVTIVQIEHGKSA